MDICANRDTSGIHRNWYATAALDQKVDLESVPIENRLEQCSLNDLLKFLQVAIDPLKAEGLHLKVQLAINGEVSKFVEVQKY